MGLALQVILFFLLLGAFLAGVLFLPASFLFCDWGPVSECLKSGAYIFGALSLFSALTVMAVYALRHWKLRMKVYLLIYGGALCAASVLTFLELGTKSFAAFLFILAVALIVYALVVPAQKPKPQAEVDEKNPARP